MTNARLSPSTTERTHLNGTPAKRNRARAGAIETCMDLAAEAICAGVGDCYQRGRGTWR